MILQYARSVLNQWAWASSYKLGKKSEKAATYQCNQRENGDCSLAGTLSYPHQRIPLSKWHKYYWRAKMERHKNECKLRLAKPPFLSSWGQNWASLRQSTEGAPWERDWHIGTHIAALCWDQERIGRHTLWLLTQPSSWCCVLEGCMVCFWWGW